MFYMKDHQMVNTCKNIFTSQCRTDFDYKFYRNNNN